MIMKHSVAYSDPIFGRLQVVTLFSPSACFLEGRALRAVEILNYHDFSGRSSVWLLDDLDHLVYMRYRFLVGTRLRNEMDRYRWLDECIAIHDHGEFDLPLVL